MKDQYFGDVNDYRKYGLLRCILDASPLSVLVAWMLTPDDGGGDGRLLGYLDRPERWSRHDPELFDGLAGLLDGGRRRSVRLIERSALLPGCRFHSAIVPDGAGERRAWLQDLRARAEGCDLVFLDPDNGIEVRSRPYGRKHAGKHVYWREIEALWRDGRSLLIYQHFPRVRRETYTAQRLDALREVAPGSAPLAFSTARVLFLLALQPEHRSLEPPIVRRVADRWAGQIDGPARARPPAVRCGGAGPSVDRPRGAGALRIRDATPADAGAIAEIYNHYVRQDIATFEEQPVEAGEMAGRMAKTADQLLPWQVLEESGRVLGYAYAAPWKARAAYRHSAEVSIYLAPDACGRGLGSRLYGALFARLPALGIHAVMGGIALPNEASVALHEKLGMRKVAHFRQTGFKFGRWIDVGYWQLVLAPSEPGSPSSDRADERSDAAPAARRGSAPA